MIFAQAIRGCAFTGSARMGGPSACRFRRRICHANFRP